MADDEASSKKVVLKIFGEELGEKLAIAAGHGKRKDYRGVLEPTGAVTQCERTGHPFVPGMPCYICGLPIPPKESLKGSEDELYVECEHIFPVTEARWFLDLYMISRPPTDAWTKRAVELEYDQAHRVCNQAKSNFSFIREDPETGNPIVNKVGIQKILRSIQIRARSHVDDYTNQDLKKRMKTIADTILSRATEIEKRVQLLITHITSEPRFRDTNMVVLMRTSLLVDPSALTPSLREIYNAWYANTENVRLFKDQLFQKFLDETYQLYPQLRPEEIMKIMSIPPEYQRNITPEFIRDRMKRFFEVQEPTPDNSGKRLLSAIYYAIYGAILIDLMPKANDTNIPYICSIYRRMNVIQQNEPVVVKIFGAVPTISPSLQARCEIELKNVERRERTAARDIVDEDLDDPLTAEEDATYFLEGLREGVEKRLIALGFTPADAARDSATIEREVKRAFLEAYPEGVSRAIEDAASMGETLIRLGVRGNPAVADALATEVYNYILSNRRDETQTYGGSGFRRRRANDQSNRPRVQKRGRTHRNRRVRRVRRIRRKSKTRR